MQPLSLQIWSDIACPWCYVGKRRLETALSRFAQRDQVQIRWRSFELDPAAPRQLAGNSTQAERLAKKYGMSVRDAQQRIEQLKDVARREGLNFDFDRIRPGNTFDAHRVVHLAHSRGKQDAMKERFLRAYLCEAEAIGEPDTLIRLASEVGLDAEEVSDTLASGAFADEVRADEREASKHGIHGVPCFVFIGRYAVSGAQAPETLLAALERAWSEHSAKPIEFGEGAVCGPDGC